MPCYEKGLEPAEGAATWLPVSQAIGYDTA